MKKLPKIILATCLCGLLCFSLAACSAAGTEPGSAAAEETAAEETAGPVVLKAEDIEINETRRYHSGFFRTTRRNRCIV